MEQNDHLPYEIVTIRTDNNGRNYYASNSHGNMIGDAAPFEAVFNRLVKEGYHLMPGTERQIITALNSVASAEQARLRDKCSDRMHRMYVCVMKKALPPK
jgi:hypothetical protein